MPLPPHTTQADLDELAAIKAMAAKLKKDRQRVLSRIRQRKWRAEKGLKP